MKSRIISKDVDDTYPCLKQHKEYGFIVLFSGPTSGMIIASTCPIGLQMGYYSTEWYQGQFTAHPAKTGPIMCSNVSATISPYPCMMQHSSGEVLMLNRENSGIVIYNKERTTVHPIGYYGQLWSPGCLTPFRHTIELSNDDKSITVRLYG